MKKIIGKTPTILLYSFCLVGVSLFWTNLAESLLFDHNWWGKFATEGSIMLYGIVLFSIFSIIEERGLSNYLVEVSLEFCVFILLYLLFGWMFKWYNIENWWAMPIQCIPIFIIVYLFRLHRIKKDVRIINSNLNNS
ncbi:MAG: hypothetical protein Q8920_15515 [Bacillota bacterium]|nr:hypothetical protein [Bacillota bacterium]